jgi:hypothetical protein
MSASIFAGHRIAAAVPLYVRLHSCWLSSASADYLISGYDRYSKYVSLSWIDFDNDLAIFEIEPGVDESPHFVATNDLGVPNAFPFDGDYTTLVANVRLCTLGYNGQETPAYETLFSTYLKNLSPPRRSKLTNRNISEAHASPFSVIMLPLNRSRSRPHFKTSSDPTKRRSLSVALQTHLQPVPYPDIRYPASMASLARRWLRFGRETQCHMSQSWVYVSSRLAPVPHLTSGAVQGGRQEDTHNLMIPLDKGRLPLIRNQVP